jgi:hypothetical protein
MNYFKYKDIFYTYEFSFGNQKTFVIRLKEDCKELKELNSFPLSIIKKPILIPTGCVEIYERVTNLYKEKTYYSCLLINKEELFIDIGLVLTTSPFPLWDNINVHLHDKYPCSNSYSGKWIIRKSNKDFLFKLVNPEESNPDNYLYVLVD